MSNMLCQVEAASLKCHRVCDSIYMTFQGKQNCRDRKWMHQKIEVKEKGPIKGTGEFLGDGTVQYFFKFLLFKKLRYYWHITLY